ncbi:hypothetical protein BDR07DRAFT_998354 [Suillus spraguei]|nr:hypothetical protein BDR07DRAFT_998354 [Suillus spraguei]
MATSKLADYIITETALLHSTKVTIVSAALIVYDHVITFDQEVDLFWTGRRDSSRFFYLNTILRSHSSMYFSIRAFSFQNYSHSQIFKALLIGNISLIALGAILCQAVIALRVWYLFARNKQIRIFAASLFIVCSALTIALTSSLFNPLYQEAIHPSFTRNPTILALVYATSDRFQRRSSLLEGFLKEGLIMYACATGSLLYTIIALSSPDVSQLDFYYTGLQGGFVVGATIVSVCHALLGIRSISATLHVDPAWLLNHAELSRVRWTKGNSEGEIFVELDSSGNTELPMANISHTLAPDTVFH